MRTPVSTAADTAATGEGDSRAPTLTRDGRSNRWSILFVALAIQMAVSIVISVPPTLLPYLKSEFGLTFAQVGIIAVLPFLSSLLFSTLVGWAADDLNERLVLIVGGVIASVGGVLCALSPTLVPFLAALLLLGLGAAMPSPAGSVAIRRAFPQRFHGSVMGVRQTGYPLGALIAASSLPAIAVAYGWRLAFVAASAVALAVAIIGFLIYRANGRSTDLRRRSSPLAAVNRNLLATAVLGILLLGAQSSLITWVVSYLVHDRGLLITTAGLYLAITQLVGAGSRVLWGVASDRWMRRSRLSAMQWAALVGAAGSISLAFVPTNAPMFVVAVGIAVCAAGAIGWNGIQTSLLSELAVEGREATTIGLGLTLMQPGQLAGPFLFGAVVDATGSFRLAWMLLAGVLALAAAGAFAAKHVLAIERGTSSVGAARV
jgi:MFS transporter, ACS family, hexuronate transporter